MIDGCPIGAGFANDPSGDHEIVSGGPGSVQASGPRGDFVGRRLTSGA